MRLMQFTGLSLFWGSLWGTLVWLDFVLLNHALTLSDAFVVWTQFVVLYTMLCFILSRLVQGTLVIAEVFTGGRKVCLENERNFSRSLLFLLLFINIFLANLDHFWLSSSGKITDGLLSIVSSLHNPFVIIKLLIIVSVSFLLALGLEFLWYFLVVRLRFLIVAISVNALIIVTVAFILIINSNIAHGTIENRFQFQRDPIQQSNEVIVLGLDGADWKVLDSLHERGLIPNLSGLIENGCRGRLKTLVPAYSPIVWTSIATGKPPEQHGITDFISYKLPGVSVPCMPHKKPFYTGGLPYFFRMADRIGLIRKLPVSSCNRKTAALWNICSINGLNNCTIGWWGTYPAEINKGVIVSDYFYNCAVNKSSPLARTLYENTVCPDSLSGVLQNAILGDEAVDYRVYRRFINGDSAGWKAMSLDYVKAGYTPEKSLLHAYPEDLSLVNIWTDHLSKHRWSMSAVYLRGIDKISHATFKYFSEKDLPVSNKYARTLIDYYIFTDSLVGEIFSANPEAVRLVVSDHGFQREGENSYYHHKQGPDGIFIISGPGIVPGHKVEGPHVLDILPTLCYLMGVPVGRDMPGRVLEEVFTDSFRSAQRLEYIDSYDDYSLKRFFSAGHKAADTGVSDEMVERLKAIGYVD
jgi:type I phosphodiesterase/nucleotide pyrophosphatase